MKWRSCHGKAAGKSADPGGRILGQVVHGLRLPQGIGHALGIDGVSYGMAEEIRLARTPLPELLDRLSRGRGPEVTAFFTAVAGAARRGGNVAQVWRQAAEELPLCDEDRDILAEAGRHLGGDETSVCKGISLVISHLGRSLEEQRRSRGEREKRVTALCFSGAALLVILLL